MPMCACADLFFTLLSFGPYFTMDRGERVTHFLFLHHFFSNYVAG